MKLSDLLDLPVFKGATLAAGKQGIEREVNTVNMMDAPDIIHFLKKNDLLITTAFHFKDDFDSLLTLIKEMEKQGCSALGIKTKRFLAEIPEAAITLANELHFPLIELPVHISLGDIVSQSLSYILDVRTNELHQAMQTHQHFTNYVIGGQGIDKIVESLSSLIEFPVVLLNYHLRPVQKQMKTISHLENLEKMLINGYSFHFPKATMSSFSMVNETQETVTLFPVYTHNEQSSYLAVLGFIPPSDRSTILTVEQASNVLAFELMKENALKQHSRRIQNEFFTNFINGRFSTNEEVISRGREFGLENEQRYICAVGDIIDEEKTISFMQSQSVNELIYETIESEIQSFHQTVHLFTIDQSYILLMELEGAWKQIEHSFLSLLTKIQAKIHTHFRAILSFGISNYSEQLKQVPISYKEAKDALYYGNMLGKKQFIEIYQPKEVPEILRMVPYDQLKKFYTDTFQAFANEPKKDHQDLLHTLSVYLETHCQISETAKRLYVHRNTVIYRLEKCEEIIGRSIKEPDETLRLRIAFRIKALLQGNN
ncbi:PucR family transcriptional regulator [Metabacillus sediminilitoris]|uniref:PucR family transcriptional regulator n=1 Tax=Metabacillus sediminilitoris TaxID=2567941 RepID=A0A4S4C3I2_9BACI|nr:PucR family transcriptional regulator [Metabacillus sediminilitoris]QGQ45400.1 PucR family transcriptional regulator [Metabacillus sediminilitoris]THF82302.1 PucR family transcriptional regulator [Metabacillus sediminilitoris]